MTVFFDLLILAFLVGAPIYFVGLFFVYRKRRRPGIVFWLVNPAVGVIWIAFILILVFVLRLKTHNTAQTASAPATSPAPVGSAANSSSTSALHFPGTWKRDSDGKTWLNASEADREALAAAFASAGNQHTATFFYTNLNEAYDNPSSPGFTTSLLVMFLVLDGISPAKSYPTFIARTLGLMAHDVFISHSTKDTQTSDASQAPAILLRRTTLSSFWRN